MLDLVHCKVLSVVESEQVDAYLLSESSMFVFPHKVVLKTCGTTTLLYGLSRLLEIAALDAGFPHVDADLNAGRAAAAAPYRVFYSRKNFLFPGEQQGPHRSWTDEVKFLDKLFVGGSAYLIGKMNGEHWYLYITGPHTELTPPVSPVEGDKEDEVTKTTFLSLPKGDNFKTGNKDVEDETLEVLMTDLDEKNARQFYLEDASAVASGHFLQKARQARKDAVSSLGTIQDAGQFTAAVRDDDASFDVFGQTSEGSDIGDLSNSEDELTLPDALSTEGHTLGTVVSEVCGLSDVYPQSKYPDARVDAYLFNPCGFSANGVIPVPPNEDGSRNNSTHYFTVHVTPEPQCSYASFETNVPARQSGRETADIIEQVVNIFKPGRFSVTLFEAQQNEDGVTGISKKSKRMDSIAGYKRVERIAQDLDGYELVFRYYERNDWKGGAPRLGEHGF
jgi:S-adenosylmethionine decarboxylase